jgi:hypothetical protein
MRAFFQDTPVKLCALDSYGTTPAMQTHGLGIAVFTRVAPGVVT